MRTNFTFKRLLTLVLAVMMLVTAMPVGVLAEPGAAGTQDDEYLADDYSITYNDKIIRKADYINKVDDLPIVPKKAENATEFVKNPAMPKLYTVHSDFKVQRGDDLVVSYQPYIATAGEAISQEEKNKIDKLIKFPILDGYTSATPKGEANITYEFIQKRALDHNNLVDNEYKGHFDYIYTPNTSTVKVKHYFQDVNDINKYGIKPGDTEFYVTEQRGLTGTSLYIQPLPDKDIKGYVPEGIDITTQVPESVGDFEVEFRYNLAHYNINYNTDGGTPIPTRTVFYKQSIPSLNINEIPRKTGSDFIGWKPSVDLEGTLGGSKITFKANKIIKDSEGNAIIDLHNTIYEKDASGNLIYEDLKDPVTGKPIKDPQTGKNKKSTKPNTKNSADTIDMEMPYEDITFKAVWKDKPKAEYVIQFWTEKPDYDDKNEDLSLRERYDFIGARRIDGADTGSTPDLTNLDIHGITFPDLNDGRLEKAQNNPKEFARYYFLNEGLTQKQNASEDNPEVQKSVLSTGETVYNVYYNRRVYILYFTSTNNEYDDYAYWPIITKDGQVLGKEGAPYKVDVRFNQSLDKIWPKDEEISGLPKGDSTEPTGDDGLIGWMINHNNNDNGVSIFRDTPPYRLSAEDFIDAKDVMSTEDESGGKGHADKIPIGENETKDRGEYEISLGASYIDTAIAYHIDIIKDDFEGKEQIDYDMSYWKSDTNTYDYEFILPHLQGFTLKKETRPAQLIGKIKVGDVEKTFDELNAERNKKTPFRSDDDKIEYISHFPWSQKLFDGTNAYDYANYYRNKYKLKLNNDPKTVKNNDEYGDGNILDVPYEYPLKDLKLDTTHKPQKPDWVPEDWDFLGWALDPAGENLVKDGNETKLHYDQILYAKWGEPEYKWKVIFDPNGGSLRTIDEKSLAIDNKTIKEDVEGKETEITYPVKKANEDDKQVFTVIQRQKLVEPENKPTKEGYDFMGWEIVRFIKDANGNYTDQVDDSYIKDYKVPELYSFGNEVVSPIYLKAIWVESDLLDIKSYHHFLDENYKELNQEIQILKGRRVGSYIAAVGSRQNAQRLLVPRDEWAKLEQNNTTNISDSMTYQEYMKLSKDPDNNPRVNSYNQQIKIEPEKIQDPAYPDDPTKLIDNPDAKLNQFHFYYRPFRQREYKVNYLDERGRKEVEDFIENSKNDFNTIKNNPNLDDGQKADEYIKLLNKSRADFEAIRDKYVIIDQELVKNGKRHFDARNYRPIAGWVLDDNPQKQIFFDIDEETNAFFGINETGLDEINFFYKDVRVIEVPGAKEPPEGYVRITFKADEGGSFGKDDKGNEIKEIHYDVIKGLKSDNIPVPEKLLPGQTKEDGKYYITPDNGKNFIKWDNQQLLNDNTILVQNYTFIAQYAWSDLHAKSKGLVMTEANNVEPYVNDFAPTIDELKAQVVKTDANGDEVALPADAKVTIVDDAGNEITQDAIYKKVKEFGEFDTNQLVRTVVFKARVTFAGNNTPQEVEVPVTIYKNVYEALTNGDMPKVLKDATAPGGDLENVTGDYVKVTVQPTNKPSNKDAKIYYVNPKAWVEIAKVDISADASNLGFTKWTADIDKQNEDGKANGVFDFSKRHKFTEDTEIKPDFSKDVVEQEKGKDKPDVPENFVKVIVTTKENDVEKATEASAFERTFWVNPTKEVTIAVDKPTGKTDAADSAAGVQAKAWIFDEWKSDETPARTWNDTIKAQFTEAVTNITANYKQADNIIKYDPEDPITKPAGYVRVKFDADEGLTLSNVQYYYVKKYSGVKLSDLKEDEINYGYPKVGAKTGYKFTEWMPVDEEIADRDITVTAKAEKLDSAIPDNGTNTKPDGYVDVVYVIKTEDQRKGSLKGVLKYFVKPNEYVPLNPPDPNPNTGYEFGAWDKDTTIPTVYEKDTTITGSFNGLDDVSLVEKPGYVKVEFTIEGDGGSIVTGQNKVFYVNPNKDVTINPPKTSANTGYEFEKWDPDTVTTAKKYTTETTVKGTFKELEDIIPSKDNNGNLNAKPEGYVTVTFTKGEHGSDISGETVFYVNPEAGKTLVDISPKPSVTPDIGYKQNGWDKEDNYPITQETTVNAKYDDFANVIPEKDSGGNPNDIPSGYIAVTFDPTNQAEDPTKKVVYVRPNTPVVLKGYEPNVTAITGFDFYGWSTDISKETIYNDGDTIVAKYSNLNDIKIKPEVGYIKVEFKTGPEGTLQGYTEFWIKPNTEVTLPAPFVTPNTGYSFTGWNKELKVKFKTGDSTYVINAEYSRTDDIIPEVDGSGNVNTKPEGYVKVTFRADDNGKLEGDKKEIVYFVNPEAGIMIVDTVTDNTKQIAVPKTKADTNYELDKWYESIDKDNSITTDLEYVARFNKGKVTLTYNEGEGTGTPPIPVIVDHGTKVRLASATGLSKTDASFAGWKLDGDEKIYQDGDLITLEKDRTATAQWTTDKDIIEYNPKEPITRPDDTYVRVTFEADNGLGLTNQKAYYVKANKGITLADAKLVKPNVTAETGYKFDKWNLSDSTQITQDITVKALATKLKAVISEKNDDGSTNKKPEGYKEVTFVIKTEDNEKGSLKGTAKFYVNPTEYVKITPPATKANTGFEFGGWDKDTNIPTVYKDGATITGSFNKLEDVIPKTKPNESEKPANYVTVTFVIESPTGGKIVDGETTVYYVKPNTDVTIKQPQTIAETGYKFKEWDTKTTTPRAYTNDITVKGSFEKLKDIIDGNEAKPDGYITVTFDKGEHGKDITGQTVYYVNPEANPAKTIGELTKPTVTPETGYKANGWDKDDNTPINGSEDIVVKAQYTAIDDIIPKTTDDESEKPDGYITVTFDKGVFGKELTGRAVYYVNPNKAVVLKDKAPTAVPNTGYKFARWDVSIDKAIQYEDGTTITALYNEPGDISTTEVFGYVKVIFDKGANGELDGTTEYWIRPDKDVNVPAPTVKPNVGYKFKDWSRSLIVNAKLIDSPVTITANYKKLDDIIPQKNTDGTDRPNGYVTVTFKGIHGTLVEPTVYYVKANTDVWLLKDDFTNTKVKNENADIGYTSVGGSWDSGFTVNLSNDTIITYTFKELPDYIEKTSDDQKPPKGYVKVTLIPTDKATKDTKANKIYFVNPLKPVTIPNYKPIGKEIIDANGNKYTYEFNFWTSTRGVLGTWYQGKDIQTRFTQDTDIEAKYNIKAEKLISGPIAKENVITPVGVTPEAKDLIKNVYDPSKPESKENLPNGTTFEYAEEPNLSKAGDTTAKVKVKYPNNKTVIVEVPIKVVDSVIPQIGNDKPKNVPSTFVKVTFDPVATKGTLEGASIYWVDPTKEVIIPVKNAVGNSYNVFAGWKIEDNDYDPTKPKKFETDTTVIASYTDSDNIIPFNPKAEPPMARPEGYVKVTFDAELGLKLRESKAYYVKTDAKDSEGQPLTLKAIKEGAGYGYPGYDSANGYEFNAWDKPDATTIGTEDIVVTALAKVTPSKPDDRPSYPEVIYRDRIVEKEKIVEKIVKVGENDELLKEIRYMQGYNGKFRPYDGLTRAEAAQILANALKADGYRYDANYNLSYTDVGNKWYTDAVRVVTQANVFQGYSDGTFRPQSKITRAEWVATLRRFQDLKEASGNTMMLRSGHWATAEVEAAYEAGWLGVYQDGTAKFDADKPITRQEVAYVSNRAFRRALDKVYIRRSVNTLLTYKDINPSMPLYEDILCASNTLLTDGRYYKANTIILDNLTFNIVTDMMSITQKKFQYNVIR